MGKVISAVIIALFAGFVGSFWVLDWMDDRAREEATAEYAPKKEESVPSATTGKLTMPVRKKYTEEDALKELAYYETKLSEMLKNAKPDFADATQYASFLGTAPAEIAGIVTKLPSEKVTAASGKLLKHMPKVQETVFPRIRKAWVSATAYSMMDLDVEVACRNKSCSSVRFSGVRYSLQSRIKSDCETLEPEFAKFRFREAVFDAFGKGGRWTLKNPKDNVLAGAE